MTRAVLVVDDDQFIRKLVATTLEDVSEFDLHEAADGVEALRLAQDKQPAIVFLDVDMPRMDGIDTCRRMRADPATSHATIVMLTAAHGDQTRAARRGGGRRPVFDQAVQPAGAAAARRPARRQLLSEVRRP